MKKIFNLLLVTALVLGFSSCEKDNYDAPEAGVFGQVVDLCKQLWDKEV